MPGSVVHCSHCGHNHVLQRIDSWREKRSQHLSSLSQESQRQPARAPQQPLVNPVRTQAKDSTLIRFPKRPAPTAVAAPPPTTTKVESLPEWRQRLDERLREIRGQRSLDLEPPATRHVEAHLDRNPIVTSALNRIQRANYLQPITSHSRYAVAAELAPELPETSAVGQFTPQLVEANPTLPRTLTVVPQVLESFGETEMPMAEMPDDFLADVIVQPMLKIVEKAETSAGLNLLEAASLAKRAAAAVIDAEILAFSMLPLFAAYFFLGGGFEAPAIYAPVIVGIMLITAYYFVTYALAGRTMGMAFMNLHLASQSATAETSTATVTFTCQQAALRALGGTASLLLFPLNFFFIVKSYDRLSLSDYLSGTQVVKIKK